MTIDELMVELEERMYQVQEELNHCNDRRRRETNINIGELEAYGNIFEWVKDKSARNGEWIYEYDDIICSECDTHFHLNMFDDSIETFRFCPHCGRRME